MSSKARVPPWITVVLIGSNIKNRQIVEVAAVIVKVPCRMPTT